MNAKKRKFRAALSVILSMLMIFGCLTPAFAMEELNQTLFEPDDVINEGLYGSTSATLDDQIKYIKESVSNLIQMVDTRRDAKLLAEAAAKDWSIMARSVFGDALNVVKGVSSVIGLVNGTISMLKMLGVIKDKSADTQQSILDGINNIQITVDRIDKNVDNMQETLINEFSELDLKFQEQDFNHYKDDVWGRFYTESVLPLLSLQNEYADDVNRYLIGWIDEWVNDSDIALRSLYGKDGNGGFTPVYSGNNLGDAGEKLPRLPRVSIDPVPIEYAVTLPGKYISDNIDLTAAVTPENCIRLLTDALEKGVYAAAQAKELEAYGGFYTEWSYLSEDEKNETARSLAADLTDSLLFAASYASANERKFASNVRSAYEAFAKWLTGTDDLTSPMYAQLKMLSLTHGFEGEIRNDAYTLYGYLQLLDLNFASFTGMILAMSRAHSASDREAVSVLWLNSSKNLGAVCRDFLTGSPNYCYPLGKTLEYREVEIGSSVSVTAAASFMDTAKKMYRNFYYDSYTTTPWTMWEKDGVYSAADNSAEKTESFNRLKNTMLSSKEAKLLYAMFSSQSEQTGFAQYLAANNAAVSADAVGDELITSFSAGDFELSRGVSMTNTVDINDHSSYVKTGDTVRVNVGNDEDMKNSYFLLHDWVTGGCLNTATGTIDENHLFAARAFYEEDATWSAIDECVLFSNTDGDVVRRENGDKYTYDAVYTTNTGTLISVPVKSFTFTANVKEIDSEFFGGETGLEKLTFLGKPEEIADDAFNGVGTPAERCMLIVPDGFDTGSLAESWHGGWFGNTGIYLEKNDGSGEKISTAAVLGEPCNRVVSPFAAPERRKFTGWSLTPDGTEPIDNSVTVAEGMTLYALWKYDHVHEFETTGARPATCTSQGTTGKSVCTVCGYTEPVRILQPTYHTCDFTLMGSSYRVKCSVCGYTANLTKRSYGDFDLWGESLSPVIASLTSTSEDTTLNINRSGVFVIANADSAKATSRRIVIKDGVNAQILLNGVYIFSSDGKDALEIGKNSLVRLELGENSFNRFYTTADASGLDTASPVIIEGTGSAAFIGSSAPAIELNGQDLSVLGGNIRAAADEGFPGISSANATASLTVDTDVCLDAPTENVTAFNTAGDKVFPLEIDNKNGEAITIDGEAFPYTASPDSTAAVTYLPLTDHAVTVGGEALDYSCRGENFMLTGQFGDFTVTYAEARGVSYAGGKLTVSSSKPVIIKNTDPSKTTSDVITIQAKGKADVTLEGVNIAAAGSPAIGVKDNSSADVKITLADGSVNTLTGGSGYAALSKNGTAGTLTLEGKGTLTATGGSRGAGIGSDEGKKAHGITVNSGIITATGKDGGAGIGSGYMPKTGDPSATGTVYTAEGITVNGGNIHACSDTGAGIGSGGAETSGNVLYAARDITVNGGTVYSEAVEGAGIGAGAACGAENICLYGGVITAACANKSGFGIGSRTSLKGLVIEPCASVKASLSGKPVNREGKTVTLHELYCDGVRAVFLNGVCLAFKDHDGEKKLYIYAVSEPSSELIPTVTAAPCEHGFVAVSGTVVPEYQTVTLKAKADEGYAFKNYVVTPAVTVTGNTFQMPWTSVTVSAVFGHIGTVTIEENELCSVTPSRSIAVSGEKITLRVVPAEGAVFEGWEVSPSGLIITNNTFVMPETDVTVKAVCRLCEHSFEEKEQPDGSLINVCTLCGYTEEHQHTFTEGWMHNADLHWHAATCVHETLVSGAAAHSWNEGTVVTEPTEDTDGLKIFVCTVCGEVRMDSIPAGDALGGLTPKIPGDVDGNGSVEAADARLALRYSVGLETLNSKQLTVADVDNNRTVDSADARLILRVSVGLETLEN